MRWACATSNTFQSHGMAHSRNTRVCMAVSQPIYLRAQLSSRTVQGHAHARTDGLIKSCEPSVHNCDCVLKAGYICIFSIEVSILENVAFERLGVKECSAGHIFILALTFFPFTQHPECISTFAAWWAVGAVNLHELTLWYVWETSCKTIHHCPKLLQQSTKLFAHSFCVLF